MLKIEEFVWSKIVIGRGSTKGKKKKKKKKSRFIYQVAAGDRSADVKLVKTSKSQSRIGCRKSANLI